MNDNRTIQSSRIDRRLKRSRRLKIKYHIRDLKQRITISLYIQRRTKQLDGGKCYAIDIIWKEPVTPKDIKRMQNFENMQINN
jgi:hypothetical protein